LFRQRASERQNGRHLNHTQDQDPGILWQLDESPSAKQKREEGKEPLA